MIGQTSFSIESNVNSMRTQYQAFNQTEKQADFHSGSTDRFKENFQRQEPEKKPKHPSGVTPHEAVTRLII